MAIKESLMTTDSDLRGIVLRRFYERRNENSAGLINLTTQDFGDGHSRNELIRICGQLADHDLIRKWGPNMEGGGPNLGHGAISASGVDVIEGTQRAPLGISLNTNNITVVGSQNVQIGDANSQKLSITIGDLISKIDNSEHTASQKEEAKSRLKQLLNNPVVAAILGGLAGRGIS
jgi:hypothetical protein